MEGFRENLKAVFFLGVDAPEMFIRHIKFVGFFLELLYILYIKNNVICLGAYFHC